MTQTSKPRRMDGYIRVSRVGARDVESESYITEAVQREKIETWASLRGVEIVAWYIDRDQTGSKLSRPGFDAVMARIQAGKTDGIVVAQIDRLSRADVADALMIVRRIHDDFNGTVAAVDLGIDPTTEVGEMLLTVLLALARMQWRRYKAAWSSAKAKAIARGAHVGATPVGYRRRDDGVLEPDPETAPVIQNAYRLCASAGLSVATRYLRSAKLTTDRRHPRLKAKGQEMRWTTTLARRVLQNRVYLGEIHNGDGGSNRKAHEPLVDLATWTAANRRLGTKMHRRADSFPLSGVVRCAGCGDVIVGRRTGDGINRTYGCRHNSLRATVRGEQPACEAPAMATAAPLEEYVRAALVNYAAVQRAEETVILVEGTEAADLEQLESALRSAELARAQDASDLRLREVLGDAAFYERMEAHNAAVNTAQDAYGEAVESASPELTWPLVDEIAAAPADELPGLLERCGVVVTLSRGKGNFPARVKLTAV